MKKCKNDDDDENVKGVHKLKSNMCIASSFNYTSLSISTKYISKTQRAKKMALFFYKTGVNSMQKRSKKWVKWKIL